MSARICLIFCLFDSRFFEKIVLFYQSTFLLILGRGVLNIGGQEYVSLKFWQEFSEIHLPKGNSDPYMHIYLYSPCYTVQSYTHSKLYIYQSSECRDIGIEKSPCTNEYYFQLLQRTTQVIKVSNHANIYVKVIIFYVCLKYICKFFPLKLVVKFRGSIICGLN